ncbi:hypothetical protein NQ318_000464 [Aromia moschata]|uniref:Uncharacterized protein n=1 Tax=Aromia moschata TaxID=1265417 RepID=A0AAV8YU86_9CUCU|nr:hypothetical protein NQ318_000464 [Aromia moschata]
MEPYLGVVMPQVALIDKIFLYLFRITTALSPTYEVCKLSNETGNVAPGLAILRRRGLEGRNSVLLGLASDLDTAQRILLQNFNTPTETVFFQEPRFFGGLRYSQKEESRLMMNHAAEGHHLQEPMKMSIEYVISCVQIVD